MRYVWDQDAWADYLYWQTQDRRVVASRITPEGLALLAKIDAPLLEFHRKQLAHVPPEQMRTVVDLLESIRGATAEEAALLQPREC